MIVTLRFSLLSIFISLFVITLISVFSVFYFHLDDLVKRAAFLLVEQDAYAIITDLNVHLYPLEGASKFTSELIESKVFDVDSADETENYLIHLLKKLPLVNGTYWGDVKGNWVYARKEDDGSITTEIIDRNSTPAKQTFIYRNQNGTEKKRVVETADFDPRTRDWYKLAFERKKTIWTDVYVYAIGPGHLGITLATPVYHADGKEWGAFGLDIRLDYLSRYVASHKIGKHGEVFIVDDKGELLASPKLTQVNPATYYVNGLMDLSALSKTYANAFNIFKKTNNPTFIFKNNGESYIATFHKIPSLIEHGWYIGIVDPESDYTAPISKLKLIYLVIDSIIFILGIIIISRLVTMIVKPIKKLEKETEYIKNFNLEPRERVFSRIREVIELSNGLHSMKMGLRSFQKYVPSSLVRQLIQLGEDVRIGGTKRDLAVFFSDIKDFTTITEKADANQLVQQVCNYFDSFSRIIIENKGTIDKYIGDALMAFWGAPIPVKHTSKHAAISALGCKQKLLEMNARWEKQGMPQLETRFGIHFGEALVGNIGSSERLNYTALGDTVNIASRIVNANKVYGTSILVSEAINQQIKKEFQLRFIDQVRFKGKAESIAIYELLAEDKQSLPFDLDNYKRVFATAFSLYQQQNWVDAIKQFEACLQIYPQDTVALAFIERCNYLMAQPPSAEWDGIWQFK